MKIFLAISLLLSNMTSLALDQKNIDDAKKTLNIIASFNPSLWNSGCLDCKHTSKEECMNSDKEYIEAELANISNLTDDDQEDQEILKHSIDFLITRNELKI